MSHQTQTFGWSKFSRFYTY
ncbi:hypothetical protein LINGRAPRIM_LOCUS414 [Linum grandiflorum]